MSNNLKEIHVAGFNVAKLKTYVKQNLALDKKMIINFADDYVRSYALSPTQTMVKLWVLPTEELIRRPDREVLDETEERSVLIENAFTLVIMRGDLFNKYISVFNDEDADVKFWISADSQNRYMAHRIVVSGRTKYGTYLSISIDTSNDDSDEYHKDYNKLTSMVTPAEGSESFTLTSDNIIEIHQTIKSMHKAIADNSAFILFEYSKEREELTVSDLVFRLTYSLSIGEDGYKLPSTDMKFGILKSDFVNIGTQSMTFSEKHEDQFIIANTNFKHSLIGICFSKVDLENALNNETTEFDPDKLEQNGFGDDGDIDDLFS